MPLVFDEAGQFVYDEGGVNSSRTIVRTGIAQFFGGTTYDADFRCYRGGPLLGYGLSTVYPYQPKRMPDADYVYGLTPGRGMGAVMVLEMPRTRDRAETLSQFGTSPSGRREILYPFRCHVYHMAHMNYAADAEQDVDNLAQAVHEYIYSDPTLGGICYQAGINSAGIDTVVNPSQNTNEITRTYFRTQFDVQVQIVI